MVQCHQCGTPLSLPIEPLYSRETVCMLVPVKSTTLARWISRHPGVLGGPWYTGPARRRRRLFSAADIRLLRGSLVSAAR